MISGQQASLAKLNKVTAEVNIYNDIGVQNKIPFTDLTLKDSQDAVLSFIFPAKTHKIQLTVSGTVKFGADEHTVSSFNQIEIDLNRQQNYLFDFYFTKLSQSTYKLVALGKNGEPKPNKQIKIKIYPDFSDTSRQF